MDHRIWRLPGPHGLIRDTVRELDRGRHVAVVLPLALAADESFVDGLVVELIDALGHVEDVRRVHVDDSGSLVETIGRALVFGESSPVTVPDLLRHPDVVRSAAVVAAVDLPDGMRREIPELLRRLELESRAIPSTERPAIVAIVGRGGLPEFAGGARSDVALATVWWWNRVSRWDVAAHTATHLQRRAGEDRVLADIRAETIVELARWDLDLAESLATTWCGDPDTLRGLLSMPAVAPGPQAGLCGDAPGPSAIDQWDTGQLDGWHDSHSTTAHALASTPDRIRRVVWVAQARILLPWIEERRVELYQRTVSALGARRFETALKDLADPAPTDAGLIEIGPLSTIIGSRIGATNPQLRSAARRLQNARNCLAHLVPLPIAGLTELVAACKFLQQ